MEMIDEHGVVLTDKLDLWNSLSKVDPQYTKQFNRSGGFKGTSTNATYIAKRLTEKFGPWGRFWGWEILQEDYIPGAPLMIDGVSHGNEIIHVIRLQLWFVIEGETTKCPPHFGQTTFVGKNKYGPFTDEEAPKKSITDAFCKAASMLGMAADIHMGLYDDNKYVNQVRKEFAEAGNGSNTSQDKLKDAINGNGHKSPDKTVEEAQAILGGQEETAYTNDAYGRIDKFLAEKTNGSESAVKSKLRSLAKSSGVDPKLLNTIESVSKLNPEQASMIAKHIKDSEDIPF